MGNRRLEQLKALAPSIISTPHTHTNAPTKIPSYTKIETYQCPRKGCEFEWLPGTGLGGKPIALVTVGQKKGRRIMSRGPACPAHFVRLVKHAEKMVLPK